MLGKYPISLILFLGLSRLRRCLLRTERFCASVKVRNSYHVQLTHGRAWIFFEVRIITLREPPTQFSDRISTTAKIQSYEVAILPQKHAEVFSLHWSLIQEVPKLRTNRLVVLRLYRSIVNWLIRRAHSCIENRSWLW